jgi:S1-C subfamily serine protease
MPDPSGRRKGLFTGRTPPVTQPPQQPAAAAVPSPPSGGSRLIQFDPNEPAPAPARAAAAPAPARATAFSVTGDILAAKQELKARLGGIRPQDVDETAPFKIVGYAIGEKTTGLGLPTGDLAVRVFVSEKLPLALLGRDEQIPETINGFPTDVIEIGEIRAFGSFRGREHPAKGGASIGHVNVTAGTLGCLVALEDNTLCILSNNHVLANVNQASVGDRIVQPGKADGGTKLVAKLVDWHEIRFDTDNEVDCAVAQTSFELASPEHHTFVIGTDTLEATLNMPVRKEGRTTGLRLGTVVGLSADIRVRYGSRQASFVNQIQIQGRFPNTFSEPGDSGSLVVEANTIQPVGLLFSGGSSFTFANPITKVMTALNIDRFINAGE